MKKMPFKSFLMKQLLDHAEGLTSQQLCNLAKPIYGMEKQCCVPEIDEMMMGMLSVGFGDVAEMKEDEGGNLVLSYTLAANMKEMIANNLESMMKKTGGNRETKG